MSKIGTTLLLLAALLLVSPPLLADRQGPAGPGDDAMADDDKEKEKKKDDEKDEDDGGSIFGDPTEDEEEEKEEEDEDEPKPATFTMRDYRLELVTEDGRFWTQDTNYTEEEKKAYLALKLRLKLPKSEDVFDLLVSGYAIPHELKYTFPDGTVIRPGSYSRLAEKYFEIEKKRYKELKDVKKPRATRLSRTAGKAYWYGFTGIPKGSSLPRRLESFFFKFKDKTYRINVIYTTTSAKNDDIREIAEDLLKSIRERKEERRRR